MRDLSSKRVAGRGDTPNQTRHWTACTAYALRQSPRFTVTNYLAFEAKKRATETRLRETAETIRNRRQRIINLSRPIIEIVRLDARHNPPNRPHFQWNIGMYKPRPTHNSASAGISITDTAPPISSPLTQHIEHIPTQTEFIRMSLRPRKPGLMPPLQRRHTIVTNPVVATKRE